MTLCGSLIILVTFLETTRLKPRKYKCEMIVMHQEDIADIYDKHKVTALFEPINNDIENYLKVSGMS